MCSSPAGREPRARHNTPSWASTVKGPSGVVGSSASGDRSRRSNPQHLPGPRHEVARSLGHPGHGRVLFGVQLPSPQHRWHPGSAHGQLGHERSATGERPAAGRLLGPGNERRTYGRRVSHGKHECHFELGTIGRLPASPGTLDIGAVQLVVGTTAQCRGHLVRRTVGDASRHAIHVEHVTTVHSDEHPIGRTLTRADLITTELSGWNQLDRVEAPLCVESVGPDNQCERHRYRRAVGHLRHHTRS